MSDLALDAADVEKLTRLANVLIPGTPRMPAIGDLASFDGLLRTAVKACGYSSEEVRAALDVTPGNADWSSARAFAIQDPARFEIASVLVSAAYFMAPVVLDRLNYPVERRHPAADDEFADEYGTGILDPVVKRGPRYRDTAKSAT